jgi:DNA-binding response OmpR family regulator
MTNLSALIVEDDKHLSLAFAEALEEANYTPVVVNDGRAALEHLEENVPAIVILDLHIPHVKGNEILEYMRSNDRLRGVRVIVATADVELAGKMKNAADLVLLKPVGFRQLKDLATRLRP